MSKAIIEATVDRLESLFFSELPAASGDKLRTLAKNKRAEIEKIAKKRELEKKKRGRPKSRKIFEALIPII
jgi:hypothetical protein